MNVVEDNAPNLSTVEREALDWIALLVSGRATADDRASLERWRGRSPVHCEAFDTAVRMVRLSRRHAFPGSEQFPPAFWERPATRRSALGGLTVAIGAVGLLRPPLGLWPSVSEMAADYKTGTGERRDLALAKGVAVTLNTRTSVGSRRSPDRVALIAGEVAVTVGVGADRRFAVDVADVTVSTNRGSFDVRRNDADVCVICMHGTARIESARTQRTLVQGQQAVVNESEIGSAQAVDASAATAWRHGELVFYDASLQTVVAEINRYRPGKIVIVRNELENRRFNSTFRIDHIDDVVADLEKLAGVSATRLPGGLVVLS